MVTANAVKVMECHNFQEFQNYREGKIAFIHDSAQLTHCRCYDESSREYSLL